MYNADHLENPRSFDLLQNYPNPFNSGTKIPIEIPKDCNATVDVYNIIGQKVITLISDKFYKPGRYQINWNGRNDKNQVQSSGIYFYKITVSGFSKVKKAILIK